VGVWTAAAVVGRWLGRRAVMPVHRMASAAAEMTATDIGRRLPTPGTGDELEVLGLAFNGLLDRLNGAFDRLNEAYDRQRSFAGDASHQLRTPLAALLGQVQLALRRDRSPEEYRRVLDLVQAEGARLRLIVESLLSLSQPEGLRIETRWVDLGDWIPDHVRRWSAHARAPDFEVDVPEEAGLFVLAQPHLLAQVLDNLLENACKYSNPGTPIVVRARRGGGSVAMTVEDRGPGLAPEDLASVFEPFFRAEQARRAGHPGVGLGLTVARRIAGTFGGTLEALSRPGAGCLFTLRLPELLMPEPRAEAVGTPWPAGGIAGQA
jgi:signal transduction histidine kinase